MDIVIGLLGIAAIVAAWYAITHHKAPVTASGKDLTDAVSRAVSESLDAFKRDLPPIISADLAQAKADLAAALGDAQAAKQALADAQAAHEAALATVASRVAAAVTASPEIPVPTPPAFISPIGPNAQLP